MACRRRQAFIWINDSILVIGHKFQWYFHRNAYMSGKWWPFCLGLNVLSKVVHQYALRAPDRTQKWRWYITMWSISPPIFTFATVIQFHGELGMFHLEINANCYNFNSELPNEYSSWKITLAVCLSKIALHASWETVQQNVLWHRMGPCCCSLICLMLVVRIVSCIQSNSLHKWNDGQLHFPLHMVFH